MCLIFEERAEFFRLVFLFVEIRHITNIKNKERSAENENKNIRSRRTPAADVLPG